MGNVEIMTPKGRRLRFFIFCLMVMVFWALDSFAGDWIVTANSTTERRNLGQKGNSESQLGAE